MAGKEATIFCVSVGVFPEALTYGKSYEVLAEDQEKRQFKVSGDNDRARWYPSYCFSSEPVATLAGWTIDDEITEDTGAVEVTVSTSDGSKFWCTFMTPRHLEQLLQEQPYFNGSSCIFLVNLDRDSIGSALEDIVSQGGLLDGRTFWKLDNIEEA